MIGLILSALGLGGIGAALMFIPGALPAALLWGRTALAWAKANPGWAVAILAVLGAAYERHQHTTWRDYAHRLETASRTAATAQAAVNHVPAILSQVIARKSDAEAPVYYAAVRSAAAAHAVIVRRPACPSSPADLPGTDRPAPLDDGPVAAADMVSRPRADDDLIVAAAGRAAQMHADAEALIAAGVAVPSDGNTQ